MRVNCNGPFDVWYKSIRDVIRVSLLLWLLLPIRAVVQSDLCVKIKSQVPVVKTEDKHGYPEQENPTDTLNMTMSEQRVMTKLRSPLARGIYYKLIEDNHERTRDHSFWYEVNPERLDPDLISKFLQCSEDEATKDFLENCYEKSSWIFTQISHVFMKCVLRWFMTQTSINGLLNRGSMFVLSSTQFHQLLDIHENTRLENLLDLGAGDGMVTKQMDANFDTVFATEASTTMVWRLQEKKYRILDLNEWQSGRYLYDVISCLNLLDRCDKPVTLLHEMRRVLKPGTGRIIVAAVIPFRPYVEFGRKDNKPSENLLITGRTFEDQVNMLVSDVFRPARLEVEKFTRVPYLCEGDFYHSFYTLDDVVFVLKAAT